MEDFLQQIEKALEYNLYYLALQAVLTLPDICSSLLSPTPENRPVTKEYIDWCNKNFSSKEKISSEDCYYFRCSMLHEGQTQHSRSNYKRIFSHFDYFYIYQHYQIFSGLFFYRFVFRFVFFSFLNFK